MYAGSMAKAKQTVRFQGRVSHDTLKMLKRAAQIEGRSLSDFVTCAAHDAANRAIQQMEVLRLAIDDQERLHKALNSTPDFT
jgi:uncharacterized protein (DUF1778 family)